MSAQEMTHRSQEQGPRGVLPALVASQDARQVADLLAVRYDMYVSEQFAADLIAFVRDMTQEQSVGTRR